MATRPHDDLQKTFLTMVAVARQDERMRRSLPEGQWDKTLDNIQQTVATKVQFGPVRASHFLQQMINPTLTAEINKRSNDFTRNSLVFPARHKLGIFSSQDENPFHIAVVDADHHDFRRPRSADAQDRRDAWKVVTDFAQDIAHAYAYVDASGLVPTIFLFHDTATRILDGQANEPMPLITKDGRKYKTRLTPNEIFQHEYAHTQYSLLLNSSVGTPGKVWNEIFANMHPTVHGYIPAQKHLIAASMITGGDLISPLFKLDIGDAPSKVYNGISGRMGASHTLLWSMMNPDGSAPDQDFWPWDINDGSGVGRLVDSLMDQEVERLGESRFARRFKAGVTKLPYPGLSKAENFSQVIGIKANPGLEALFSQTVLDRGASL